LSFVSPWHMARLSAAQYRSLALLGYHPETHDELFIPHLDRYAGTYVLGVQGSGKSGLLQNPIAADMRSGHAVIVIDAHRDLITSCISHVPYDRLKDTYLLDMEDEAYPFGVNLFSTGSLKTSLERAGTVERILHVFQVLWPEVATQQYLPMFLPNTIQVFLDNPGKTLVDMIRFFRDDAFRAAMLQNVKDPMLKDFWHYEYDKRGDTERRQRAQSLMNRLVTLFTGHSLVRNILGQPQTTISFRKAIEAKQIIFIKLPTTNIRHVARLIGTILLAQIEAAVFSFGDIPEAQRPGVSLYMDEFQEFATEDIERLFTQGRKFGMRLTVAHQQRDQLPGFLQSAVMTARTTVCFRLTPEDGREMAHFFPSQEATVQPDDIETEPVSYLLHHPSNDPAIRFFTDTYLHPMREQKRRGGRIDIETWRYDYVNARQLPNRQVVDPTVRMNNLLLETMREGNWMLPIPPEVVAGFSICGRGFYQQARGLAHNDPLLQADAKFPRYLVVQAANGELRWTRKPESDEEQLFHFVFHLRLVMQRLAEEPIGKQTTATPAEVARMLTQLPKRAAFVRSGDTVGVIYTHNTPEALPQRELFERANAILQHTRVVYCKPRAEVERLFMQSSQQPPALLVQPIQAEEIE